MFQNADEVLSYISKNDVQFIDVRFCDLPGVMQHFTFPASNFGPAAEFYIFDSIRYDQNQHSAYHYIDSVEAAWNTGREEPGGNKGYKPAYKGGYFPVPPVDHFTDLRSEMVRVLLEIGIDV